MVALSAALARHGKGRLVAQADLIRRRYNQLWEDEQWQELLKGVRYNKKSIGLRLDMFKKCLNIGAPA